MPQFFVRKLIRDKFSDLDHWDGKRVLSEDEYLHELKRKLIEEAEEVMEARALSDVVEELADLQDIIDHLLKALDVSKKEIEAAQAKKFDKRGGFEKRIFAERIVLQDGHRLVAHCRSQPHKYEEIET